MTQFLSVTLLSLYLAFMCMAHAILQALFCVGVCDAFLIHCYVDVLKGFLSFSVISFCVFLLFLEIEGICPYFCGFMFC